MPTTTGVAEMSSVADKFSTSASTKDESTTKSLEPYVKEVAVMVSLPPETAKMLSVSSVKETFLPGGVWTF